MKRLLSVICLTVLLGGTSLAQVITGIVKDAKTNVVLPFVNVGIVGKSVGTVTNDAGVFKINANDHPSDTLKISMIGYRPQAFVVADAVKNTNGLLVALVPEIVNLKEVKVGKRKWKTGVLGNTTKSQSITAGFTTNALGHEIGAIIKTKRSPTWLKQFNTSIINNVLIDSVKLRLNIYSVKDGLPYQNLLQQNIFVTVRKGDQSISINLEPYNVMVEDKFFISLEWLQAAPGRGILFSASLFSSSIIARETSQAEWMKVGMFGVGFNVLAEY